MKVSISYESSNRFFGKFYRKCYEIVETLENELALVLEKREKLELLEIWIVDEPLSYVEVSEPEAQQVSVYVGRDIEYDYRPLANPDINQFKELLYSQIKKVISKSFPSKATKMDADNAIDNWKNS